MTTEIAEILDNLEKTASPVGARSLNLGDLLQMSETEVVYDEEQPVPERKNKRVPAAKPPALDRPVKITKEPHRVSGVISAELAERLRNYVIYEVQGAFPDLTVNDCLEEAIENYMEEKEKFNGGPFPLRNVEIRRGRRPSKK